VEVAVWQEDGGILARMGSEGEDAHYGSEGGGKGVVMARTESPFNACPIGEDEESHDEVFGVGDRVNKH